MGMRCYHGCGRDTQGDDEGVAVMQRSSNGAGWNKGRGGAGMELGVRRVSTMTPETVLLRVGSGEDLRIPRKRPALQTRSADSSQHHLSPSAGSAC